MLSQKTLVCSIMASTFFLTSNFLNNASIHLKKAGKTLQIPIKPMESEVIASTFAPASSATHLILQGPWERAKLWPDLTPKEIVHHCKINLVKAIKKPNFSGSMGPTRPWNTAQVWMGWATSREELQKVWQSSLKLRTSSISCSICSKWPALSYAKLTKTLTAKIR